MNEVATDPAAPGDACVLAGELVRAFAETVKSYERHYGLSREDEDRPPRGYPAGARR